MIDPFIRDWTNALQGNMVSYGSVAMLSKALHQYTKLIAIDGILLDLGCGPIPLSSELSDLMHPNSNPGLVRILLDKVEEVYRLASLPDNPVTAHVDVGSLVIPDENSSSNIERYAHALNEAKKRIDRKGIDTIIAAAVVNYIPFEGTFKMLDSDLKSGGLIFLSNTPAGYFDSFFESGPIIPGRIINFFNRIGYRLLYQKNDQSDIALVLQKP